VKTPYWIPSFKRTALMEERDRRDFPFECGLAALALIGLIFIGYRARTATTDFQFVSCTPGEEAAIASYAPYVRQVDQLLAENHQAPLSQAARKLAREWVQATQDGTLKQILPSTFTDLSIHGARHEIVAANDRIAEELNWGAVELTERGQYSLAAQDTMLAARVVQTTKFFDLYSVGISGSIERDSITRLDGVYRFLSPEMKCEAKQVAEQIKVSPAQLEPLAVNMRRNTLSDAERLSNDPATMRSVEADLPFDRMLNGKSLESVSEWANKQRPLCQNDSSFDVCRYLFLAYRGAEKTNERLDKLEKTA